MTENWRAPFRSLVREFREASRLYPRSQHFIVKATPDKSIEGWKLLERAHSSSSLFLGQAREEQEVAYFVASDEADHRFMELVRRAGCCLPVEQYPRDPIHELSHPIIPRYGPVEAWIRFVYLTLKAQPGVLFSLNDGSQGWVSNLPFAHLNVNIFEASAIAIECAILTSPKDTFTPPYLGITLQYREASRTWDGKEYGDVEFGKKEKPWNLFVILINAGERGVHRRDLENAIGSSLDKHKKTLLDLIEGVKLDIHLERGMWTLIHLGQ